MTETYRPVEFLYESPPPRLIGIEMEYHYQLPHDINQVDINRGLRLQTIASVSGFNSNGSRVYPDVGHIEYATPESLGPWQAAAADHSGMFIIDSIVKSKIDWSEIDEEQTLPVMRITGSFDPDQEDPEKKFKSNGYHENYLTPNITGQRREMLKDLAGSYFATRIIWNGNGMVADNRYLLSQKAPGIGENVVEKFGNRTTHGKKPLAGMLSDEKTTDEWSLLEVRSADSHMSRFCTFVGLAATSAMLRLVEHGTIHQNNADKFTLVNPVKALHRLNQNFGRGRIRLNNGGTTTALSLQTRFFEEYMKLSEKGADFPADEVLGVQEALETCDVLRQVNPKEPDLKPLVQRVEWAAKLYYMQKTIGENLFNGNLDQAISRDRQWHRLDLRVDDKNSKFWRRFDPYYDRFEPEVHSLKTIPPFSRAFARGCAIESGRYNHANWHTVGMPSKKPVMLDDPYSPNFPGDIL